MTVVTFGLCVTLFYSILIINTCEPCSYIKNLNFSAIISFYPQMRGLRTELVCVETLDWQASLGSGRLNRSPVKVLGLHCQVERLQGALPKQAGEFPGHFFGLSLGATASLSSWAPLTAPDSPRWLGEARRCRRCSSSSNAASCCLSSTPVSLFHPEWHLPLCCGSCCQLSALGLSDIPVIIGIIPLTFCLEEVCQNLCFTCMAPSSFN